MNNYYDNILIKSAEEQKINYTVIPNLSNYIGNLKKNISPSSESGLNLVN